MTGSKTSGSYSDLINVISDPWHEPDIGMLHEYVSSPCLDHFLSWLLEELGASYLFEYSRCSLAPGWNLKIRRGRRRLCVIYPHKGYFSVMVVIGRKEKERAEKLLSGLSDRFRQVYDSSREVNGQRWLMVDIGMEDELFQDLMQIIRLRLE